MVFISIKIIIFSLDKIIKIFIIIAVLNRTETYHMIINSVKRKTIIRTNITQAELAKKLGYSGDQIRKILNGERTTPHIQEAVADYFGRSVESIFGTWAWTKIIRQRGRRMRINGGMDKKKGLKRRRRNADRNHNPSCNK